MPALQQLYIAISNLRYSGAALENLKNELINKSNVTNMPQKKNEKFLFAKSIEFKNVSYKYSKSEKNILKNLNFKIRANTKIGVVGKTGSGKTTLVDLLSGLLKPSTGQIIVDNEIIGTNNLLAWRDIIGYVPQNIFLNDSCIYSNIAFGLEKKNIDKSRVEEVAEIANLHEFIKTDLEYGYETIVGDNGAKLSGGQIQRIGIARALYKLPKIIVFDEGTSALDSFTENKIMHNIYEGINKKNITIIFITHNYDVVKNFDQFLYVHNNQAETFQNYNDFLNKYEDNKKK